jgi:tripartite-type tricarboxylate transporter receptor subunit TctC
VLARTLGQSLAKTWGQQPVIDNRPSAGGIVASQALTQAAPDGTTLIPVASGHPLNQFIYPKLPYDTFKDFTAISEIASSPLAILVSKTSPCTNLQDLLTAARKDPDSLSYGMAGNRTSSHLAGELFEIHGGREPVRYVSYLAFAGACRCHRSSRQCSAMRSISARPDAA